MSQLELLTQAGSAEQAVWRSIAKVAGQVEKREIRPYVLLSLKECSGVIDERIKSVSNKERFACVRAVVRHLCWHKSATSKYRNEEVQAFLEGIKFSPECVEELTSLLCTDEAYSRIQTLRTSGDRLQTAVCRVDISLCQVNLEGVIDPEQRRAVMRRDTRVVLALTTHDGNRMCYRMSVARFQELRLAVATLLKQMLVSQRRQRLAIKD